MAAKRKAIGNAKRFKIFQRDGFQCQYCGASPPAVILHVDHVLAVANGGGDSEDNLLTACSNCNHGKFTKPLDPASVPRDYAKMADDAKQRAAQLAAYRKHLLELQSEMDQSVDAVGRRFWGGSFTWNYETDVRSRRRVEHFIRIGGLASVMDAADVAYARLPDGDKSRDRFRYFCGVMWNRCEERRLMEGQNAE